MTEREIIEELKMRIDNFSKETFNLINRQKAEIERLNIESETLATQLKGAYEQIHKLNMAKSESIKEFAERLKHFIIPQKAYGYTREIVLKRDIDNLVKEMEGSE